jgi:hypothetical protein
MKEVTIIYLMIFLLFAVPWVINLNKLSNCDFTSPYKCEVLHGVGIIPPLQIFMVWFKSDEVTNEIR